jgi:ribosome-associated toxin RatA of RatAB toxin-antitoxin module
MKTKHVEVSHVFNATPQELYAIISDFKKGLPSILPKKYFTGWKVEKGGNGAGTIVNVKMTFFGKDQHFRLAVTEPKPGRELVETDTDTGKYTRFTFKPLDDGKRCEITIDSKIPVQNGLLSYFKSLMVANMSKGLYKSELLALEKKITAK